MARFFKDFPQKCGKRRDRKCLRRKGLRRHGKNGAPIARRWLRATQVCRSGDAFASAPHRHQGPERLAHPHPYDPARTCGIIRTDPHPPNPASVQHRAAVQDQLPSILGNPQITQITQITQIRFFRRDFCAPRADVLGVSATGYRVGHRGAFGVPVACSLPPVACRL